MNLAIIPQQFGPSTHLRQALGLPQGVGRILEKPGAAPLSRPANGGPTQVAGEAVSIEETVNSCSFILTGFSATRKVDLQKYADFGWNRLASLS